MCVVVCAYAACLYDQTSCGCCLMAKQLERMKSYTEGTQRKMSEQMRQAIKILGKMRGRGDEDTVRLCRASAKLKQSYFFCAFLANRAAFSPALNDNTSLECFGPFKRERSRSSIYKREIIVYKRIFLNMGHSYNQQSGVFVIPHSGVYSFSEASQLLCHHLQPGFSCRPAERLCQSAD